MYYRDVLTDEIEKVGLPQEFEVLKLSNHLDHGRTPTSSYLIVRIGYDETLVPKYSVLQFRCDPSEGVITDFYIDLRGDLRKRGYGRKLVDAAENFARGIGCNTIEASWHVPHNDVIGLFLKHIGYSLNSESGLLRKSL